ncbi:MAG: hypothetical protein IJ744_06410, partial [Lachnospiraceae bacterium]|nr:hypothetical protein [Lachnospiraceae bacterium]
AESKEQLSEPNQETLRGELLAAESKEQLSEPNQETLRGELLDAESRSSEIQFRRIYLIAHGWFLGYNQ